VLEVKSLLRGSPWKNTLDIKGGEIGGNSLVPPVRMEKRALATIGLGCGAGVAQTKAKKRGTKRNNLANLLKLRSTRENVRIFFYL